MHHWLVTYCDLCIERRDYRYNTSPIGHLGKGSTVGWYKVLGFLGVITLNSPGGVLPRWFSSFVNKSPVSNLISTAFSYLVICLCYHAIACNLTN